MQDLFANKFLLDRKIMLPVAGGSENRKKNGFQQPENQFPLAGKRLFFKNWISTSRKKSSNKRILFQVDRKLVSTSRDEELV